MAVCKYLMASGYGGGTAGTVVSFSPVRYSETCFQKNNIDTSPKDYVYIANKNKRALLMFETFETLLYKVKQFYALYAHPNHGVALYDVDYDDNTNGCGSETFRRVRQMKRYLHF
ncbi:hypothetical protein V5799_027750 [Amblyomma americanum]|uniref:Uncharacterized protein n=1 Tax=Amblyomma americanum TaxID=6943 RepID=A0AAQ4DEU3_AMBAM